MLTTPHRKILLCYGTFHKASDMEFNLIVPVVRNKEFFCILLSFLGHFLPSVLNCCIIYYVMLHYIIILVLSQNSHLPH